MSAAAKATSSESSVRSCWRSSEAAPSAPVTSAGADPVPTLRRSYTMHIHSHVTLHRVTEAVERAHASLEDPGHGDGNAAGLHRDAGRLGLEGIIAKRADAPYRAGRSAAWLKIKCLGRDDLIVLGWTPPGGSRPGIGALALGFYDPERNRHY